MKADAVTRFWAKVNKTETCWFWTAAKNDTGYGVFGSGCRGRGNYRAHVFSWELHNNACIIPGYFVCHKCDNPGCVNPDHLWLGTQKENMNDCKQKQRNSKPPVHKGEYYTNGRKRK